MFSFIKYFFFLLILSCFCLIGFCIYIYQDLRYSTPSLSDLAQNLDPFSVAIAFNYSKNIDKQLYLFSKNIGLENNPLTKQEEPIEGNIGANGFFIFDARAGYAQNLCKKLDHFLNDALDFLDEESAFFENNDIHKDLVVDATEGNSQENLFVTPFASLLEEFWNGKTFLIGGATQFSLSYKDSFLLALEPYIKNFIKLKSNFFRDMIIQNAPMYVQDFLNKHSINVSIEPAILELDNAIHESQIVLTIRDSQEFLDSICSFKINPWDMCGRFSIDRKKFRKNANSIIGLVNHNFKVSLHVYWAVRGKDIIYSNQKDLVMTLLNGEKEKRGNNVLTSVAASGDDFLFASKKNLKYTSLSIYFDMIKSQNEGISLIESLKKYSDIMSDYFASPNGEILFALIEKKINEITRFSQKTSIAFHTDGEKLFPELRLYSPSHDLFINEGKELSPHFSNSIKIFVTRAISFGNYLLPRGLVPIPGPILQRNGRWAILRSELFIKSMAPYLESVDPFIDRNDTPSEL